MDIKTTKEIICNYKHLTDDMNKKWVSINDIWTELDKILYGYDEPYRKKLEKIAKLMNKINPKAE